MPTLESVAETRLRLMVAPQTLIDWTNQRDDDAAENTAITAAAVEMACAEVKSYLGNSVDGDDSFAVDKAVRICVLRLSNWWNVGLTADGNGILRGILSELEREADARRQGKRPSVVTPDTFTLQELDERYPQQLWADGTRFTGKPSDDDDV